MHENGVGGDIYTGKLKKEKFYTGEIDFTPAIFFEKNPFYTGKIVFTPAIFLEISTLHRQVFKNSKIYTGRFSFTPADLILRRQVDFRGCLNIVKYASKVNFDRHNLSKPGVLSRFHASKI